MYLADCVIHLRYQAMEGEKNRMLKIVKCRNSWHSENFHPYRIINGLGLVVQQGDFKKKISKESQAELMKILKKNAKLLPDNVYTRMQKTLNKLSDSELGEITQEELVRYILDEYS
jgi:hypothetical protein